MKITSDRPICDGCKRPIMRKVIIVRKLPYHPKCSGRKTGKLGVKVE